MAVILAAEARKQAMQSLRRFCTEELEIEVSDLQVIALLDYFLKEIAPSVHNTALADAQAFLRDRLADLEGTCSEPEFAYWPKSGGPRRRA